MKLFIVSVKEWDYDEYDSLVVSAESAAKAKKIATKLLLASNGPLKSKYIGEYHKDVAEIVHASFNAG